MCRVANVISYQLSIDRTGLIANFKNGTFYTIHSESLTELEVWIHETLLKGECYGKIN